MLQAAGAVFSAAWLMLAGTASAAFGGPAVATRWNETKTMSQEECLKRAEDAIQKLGFGKIERTQQSRYGTLQDYTAVARCITSNGIVLFIGSGPDRKRADELAGALFQGF